jgi:tetratricopeptide (TPR) repeat protein
MGRNGEGWAKDALRLLGTISAFYCLLAATALGQQNLNNTPETLNRQFVRIYTTTPGTGLLVFTVFAEKSSVHLDRQALLKLVNLTDQTTTWQTTEEDSKGAFSEVQYGNYDVEISAAGYLSAHKEMHVTNSQLNEFEIVLHRDPAAISLDVDDRALSPKARRETKHAVAALKARNYKDAQKLLDEAYKSAPSSADLNFLLGYLYFQQKDYEKASQYLGTATTLNPRNGQGLTLLGRTCLERKDYVAAQAALERAVAADGDDWLPHDLLADAYFRQKNYEKAREQALLALAQGKAQASAARLVLGESLINLGFDEQGIKALDAFLNESPSHPMAGQVRSLIAEVREHEAGNPSAENAANTKLRLSGVDPLEALAAPGLSMKSWQPPSIDESKVGLASGVACPSEMVLGETGKRVGELVDDVARFSAIEDLFHQSLDVAGNPLRTETRKYNYVASISEPEPGFLAVDESRAEKSDLGAYPDHIASTGFAALALVFHPHMRDNFDMKCEGLGDWRGQASWLVYFKQRDDKPSRMHSYKVGKMIYPVKLKGRAWITADKFQIVRIEAEMIRPMPEIRLLSEHQVVEYGPIRFEKKNTSIWLPKSAEIYFDFRQHRYYRRHSFDNYMLFSVDSDEKRKEPVIKPPDQPGAAGE